MGGDTVADIIDELATLAQGLEPVVDINVTEVTVEEEEDVVDEFEISQQYEKMVQKALNRLDWCKNSTDRKRAEDRWTDAQNFWLGKQWDGVKSFGIPARSAESKKMHPNPVDNYFKAHIEGLVGDVTDRPVDIQIRPREEGDDDIARQMDEIAKYLWYVNKGDRKLEFAVRRGLLYGPLIAKVHWDNTVAGSPSNPFIGDVRFFIVPPTNLFIDPRIRAIEDSVLQKAEFVIYGVRRSLAYVREQYPEKGGEVHADTYASYVTTLSDDEDTVDYIDDTDVLLIEYWYKGEPMAPDFPAGESRQPSAGWVHKAVIAGGVLLEHRTYVYPWFPFVMEWVYPSDESIYGYGDAYDILIPQLIINKLNEISVEGASLLSQGNWVTEEGNIRNKAQFQKYAGMGGSVLPVVDVGRTTRVPGGNVPSSLFAHYRQELQAMETVCGRYDVSQGRTPRNVQAASAIALLLQQAGGRVRQRARAVSSFVEQIVKMMLDLVGEHYTQERVIRVTGPEGQVSWRPVSNRGLFKTKVWVDPMTGQQFAEEYVPEMDVIVTAGTDTPTSRAYYSELAMQLFQSGVIDDIALLDTLQFPRWREILARRKQSAMQQQMQQAGMPPGDVPPELLMAIQAAAAQQGGQSQGGSIPPELAAMQGAAQMEVNPYAQLGGSGGGSAPSDIGQLAQLIEMLQQQESGGGV
jgi:hypothetical protein